MSQLKKTEIEMGVHHSEHLVEPKEKKLIRLLPNFNVGIWNITQRKLTRVPRFAWQCLTGKTPA